MLSETKKNYITFLQIYIVNIKSMWDVITFCENPREVNGCFINASLGLAHEAVNIPLALWQLISAVYITFFLPLYYILSSLFPLSSTNLESANNILGEDNLSNVVLSLALHMLYIMRFHIPHYTVIPITYHMATPFCQANTDSTCWWSGYEMSTKEWRMSSVWPVTSIHIYSLFRRTRRHQSTVNSLHQVNANCSSYHDSCCRQHVDEENTSPIS